MKNDRRIDQQLSLTRPLRILALNWRCPRHPQAGGAEANVFACAKSWVRAGHQVTIFCADPGRVHAPERDEVMDGVSVLRRGGRFSVYLAAAQYLIRHGRSYDYILDVANGIPFFSPAFTSVPATLFVHHVHDRQWFAEFPTPVAFLGRWLERRAVPHLYRQNMVVAVSPTTRDGLLALGVPTDRIKVVYSGVSHDAQSCQPPAEVGQRPPTVIYVGRLKRYKRVDQLIRMVPALRQEVPTLRLDIVGDGDARSSIASLIDRMGLQDCITLHGFVDEQTKARLLSRATVFATPSMHEGWGLSVIEANTFGCPAVAYDVPGLSVAIRHGTTGLLATDEHSFIDALRTLLTDKARRNAYGEAARSWAAQFDWESSATETLEVLMAGVSSRTGATTFGRGQQHNYLKEGGCRKTALELGKRE